MHTCMYYIQTFMYTCTYIFSNKKKVSSDSYRWGFGASPLTPAQQILEGMLSKEKLEGIDGPLDTFKGQ